MRAALTIALLLSLAPAVPAADLSPDQVLDRRGEEVTVRFKVRAAGENVAGFDELYSEAKWDRPGNLFVRIPDRLRKEFRRTNRVPLDAHFLNEEVRVTGIASSLTYKGVDYPAIVLSDLDCIEIVTKRRTYSSANEYVRRRMGGLTVLVHRSVYQQDDDTSEVFAELASQIENIRGAVTPEHFAFFQKVNIWVDWDVKTEALARFHPSAYRLKELGLNPDKAGGVEFPSVRKLLRDSKIVGESWVLTHELAHALHHRALGDEHAGIDAAYRAAMERKLYEVSRGVHRRRPDKAYAATNRYEYFAMLSEAYLGRCDEFPHTREDLRQHDPQGYKTLQQVWDRFPKDALER